MNVKNTIPKYSNVKERELVIQRAYFQIQKMLYNRRSATNCKSVKKN